MIKVGDRVKLLNDVCFCGFCKEARRGFHTVVSIEGEYIKIALSEDTGPFPMDWGWEVETYSLENE